MKNILIGIIVLVVVGTAGFYLTKGGKSSDYGANSIGVLDSQNSEVSSITASTSITKEKTYTLADVILHNSEASCWSAVNNKVYDLTSWISKHPGGRKEILSICGKDGTFAFMDEHEGDRKPEEKLAAFYVGALTQ